MRFMMLMIPKGYEKAEAGAMPSAEMVAKMTKYNQALTKAGVLIALDGLHPASNGAHLVLWRESEGDRRALHRGEGAARRLLDDSGEVEARGGRMGIALPRSRRRRDRGSSGAGDVGLPSRGPEGRRRDAPRRRDSMSVTPYLNLTDANAAIEFYVKALVSCRTCC